MIGRQLVEEICFLDVFCSIVTLLNVLFVYFRRGVIFRIVASVFQRLNRNSGVAFGELSNPA
jgi:hypothetical protein